MIERPPAGTSPAGGLLQSCRSFSEFGLDGLVVVSVSAAGALAQHLALGNLADEHHVTAQVQFFLDFAAEHGVGIFDQVQQAVVAALDGGEALKLVHIPAGLHTEVADGLEGDGLGQHADIEFTGLFHDFTGQIFLLAGDRQPEGIGGHLNGGIDDTAVVFLVRSGQHEQAVA